MSNFWLKNDILSHLSHSCLSGLIKCFNLGFSGFGFVGFLLFVGVFSNESNPNIPAPSSVGRGCVKHKTEGSVRTIWTVVCRRMSRDSSLSPAQDHCQQEAVPTLHHVVCLQAAAQHRASSAEAGWRGAVEGEKQGTNNYPSVRINCTSPP